MKRQRKSYVLVESEVVFLAFLRVGMLPGVGIGEMLDAKMPE